MNLQAPAPIADHHDLAAFDCGVDDLNDWLRRRARPNQVSGASRTFVLCSDAEVLGYYALASGVVSLAEAPGGLRRNMPDPIPMVVLGRLAVDVRLHGRGVGRALFQNAVRRVVQASESIGVRGLLVHAISPTARDYLAQGLEPSRLDNMTLMARLDALRAGLTS